jgi:hypothetical protein
MRRTRAWLVLGPVVLGGVLAGHGLAYRLTATPEGAEHGYLGHASQILLVLVLLGAALTGVGPRAHIPSRWTIPLAALGTFVVQEHVERLVHGGTLPWVLTTPAFLVGLALQLPLALFAWVLTRGVLEALVEPRASRAPSRSRLVVALTTPHGVGPSAASHAAFPVRGPPLGSRS